MDADERDRSGQPSFPQAVRRAEGAPDAGALPGRRFDFIPILDPPPLQDPRAPRLRARVRRLAPTVIAIALIGTLVIALVNGRAAQSPSRPQKLPARAAGPLEARDTSGRRALASVRDGTADVTPRTVKVTVTRKGKTGAESGPRRARVVLADGGPPVAGTDDGWAEQTDASSTKSTSPGKKGSKSSGPSPPPEPSRPLYHLYKGGKRNDHWFTTSAAERDDRLARGYEMVAVEGFVFGRSQDGTLPLNTDNGIPGHIYEEPRDGYIPLHMFRGYNGYGDLFTSDESRFAEYEEQGWNPYGIVGYVLPAS